MIDNKAQYSFLKLLENMFENEAYQYLATGQIEQISKVTPNSLYNTYQSMIQNDYCAVYVVGNVNQQQVIDQINTKFNIEPFIFETTSNDNKQLENASNIPNPIVETDDVDQAKLNLGYRFPTHYGKNNYYAFIVFNIMFGGDPSSVLFNEVRERQSLAYSIHSQIDGKNGYLFVLSGVSADKYEVAKQTILEEFDKFKKVNLKKVKLN